MGLWAQAFALTIALFSIPMLVTNHISRSQRLLWKYTVIFIMFVLWCATKNCLFVFVIVVC